jgi:deazaflavin-dependent oxidoreductase (nitroreductase family)
LPTAVLETRGAKTGLARRHAVIYFHDGDRVTIVASKFGFPENPAWYHNLLAHPDVIFGGAPYRAVVITDEADRARLWGLADRVLPAFAIYRERAEASGRTIPIVQLIAS